MDVEMEICKTTKVYPICALITPIGTPRMTKANTQTDVTDLPQVFMNRIRNL